MIRFLLKVSNPAEIFDEEEHIFARFKQIEKDILTDKIKDIYRTLHH